MRRLMLAGAALLHRLKQNIAWRGVATAVEYERNGEIHEHDENDGEDEENHETEEAPEWWKEGESDLDKLKNNKEDKKDISQLSQREIQNLIDDALDAKNYDEVRRLSQYLKEGKEIYLRELKRINENQTKRNK